MASEKSLWKWWRNKIIETPGLHIQRVENSVGNGVPDVEGCLAGSTFWVELKRTYKTPTGIVRVTFQPMQKPWLSKRWHCGGRAFVLVGVDQNKRGTLCHRYLVPADSLQCFNEETEEAIAAVSYTRPDATAQQILEAAAGLHE